MRRWMILLTVAVAAMTVLAAPAGAVPDAQNTQVGGTGVYEWSDLFGDPYGEGDICEPLDGEFAAYSDFVMRIEGDLTGCWYQLVDDYTMTPSGAYKEHGREVFVADGTGDVFQLTYTFTGKFDADGNEIHGRCQHKIVAGSGTRVFEGATGRIDFKDDVDAGINYYRGHIKLANGG